MTHAAGEPVADSLTPSLAETLVALSPTVALVAIALMLLGPGWWTRGPRS